MAYFTGWRPKILPERRLQRYLILLVFTYSVVHCFYFHQAKMTVNERQASSASKEGQKPVKVGVESETRATQATKPPKNTDSPEVQLYKFMIESYNELGRLEYSKDLDWISLIDKAFGQTSNTDSKNAMSSNHFVQNLALWLKLNAKQKMGIRASRNDTKRSKKPGPKINLATVICGSDRKQYGLTMIKSAAMFAQDASLNVIVFSDAGTIVDLGMDLLQLRWSVNLAGFDFNFELHPEEYPENLNSTAESWRKKYKPCEALPMMFPVLLPHIDSLIYLANEVVILSNLTELWTQATSGMGNKWAAAAAHTEANSVNYYTYSKVPHVGKQGISSGVMLMNLAQMRQFSFTDRAIGVYEAYAELMKIGFQDVINAMFHVYEDRLHWLSCAYNFYYVHCDQGATCNRNTNQSTCFCEEARSSGVRLIYGCGDSFSYLGPDHFIAQAYSEFSNFDVIHEPPLGLLDRIRKDFEVQSKCYNVTYDQVYKNAKVYLEKLGNK